MALTVTLNAMITHTPVFPINVLGMQAAWVQVLPLPMASPVAIEATYYHVTFLV